MADVTRRGFLKLLGIAPFAATAIFEAISAETPCLASLETENVLCLTSADYDAVLSRVITRWLSANYVSVFTQRNSLWDKLLAGQRSSEPCLLTEGLTGIGSPAKAQR